MYDKYRFQKEKNQNVMRVAAKIRVLCCHLDALEMRVTHRPQTVVLVLETIDVGATSCQLLLQLWRQATANMTSQPADDTNKLFSNIKHIAKPLKI